MVRRITPVLAIESVQVDASSSTTVRQATFTQSQKLNPSDYLDWQKADDRTMQWNCVVPAESTDSRLSRPWYATTASAATFVGSVWRRDAVAFAAFQTVHATISCAS